MSRSIKMSPSVALVPSVVQSWTWQSQWPGGKKDMIFHLLIWKGQCRSRLPFVCFQIAFRLLSTQGEYQQGVCLNLVPFPSLLILSNSITFHTDGSWFLSCSINIFSTGNSVSECRAPVNQQGSFKPKERCWFTCAFLLAYLFSVIWGYTEIENGKWLMQLCESPSICPIFLGL